MENYSLKSQQNKRAFRSGMKDGIPIGLGYLAVSFSLGIAAKNAGLSATQGFIVSFLNSASAGEYVGFTLIAAAATYIEMAIATFIANARYILMSCALSQRAKSDMPLIHRMIVAFGITDEIFGIAIARKGWLNPYYSYGAMTAAIPLWAFGTMMGVIAGNMLPLRLVSAFSVALYGMFLAVIIPPARKSKIIAGLIVISFICSYLAGKLTVFSGISDGTRTIILTAAISIGAAVLFPVKDGKENKEEAV